ncbi:hypothetical protein A9Q79_01185 [Methylophaga sp. 42_25_T18]|nr:hypothetical protein A9Q79_01185 [Methylophaga sp. 42_25_T18]
MAENEDEGALETEKVNDEEGSETEGEAGDEGGSFLNKIKNKINLSKSMMIYIAIGLAVLLVAIGGYLFFTSGDEPVENELTSEVLEQDAAVESDGPDDDKAAEGEAEEEMVSDALSDISAGLTTSEELPEEEAISEEGITIPDLAPLPDTSTAISSGENDIMLPPTPEMPDVSGAVVALPETVEMPIEDAEPLTPEDKAMELFKLREQALILEEENRRLKQRLSSVEGQGNSGESKSATTKPREREPELSKPRWGDFAPIYRGP